MEDKVKYKVWAEFEDEGECGIISGPETPSDLELKDIVRVHADNLNDDDSEVWGEAHSITFTVEFPTGEVRKFNLHPEWEFSPCVTTA